MKSFFYILILSILFCSCGIQSKKQEQQKQQQIRDSIRIENNLARAAQRKIVQMKQDSINRIEEKIAISNIKFEISKTKFDREKNSFLRKIV